MTRVFSYSPSLPFVREGILLVLGRRSNCFRDGGRSALAAFLRPCQTLGFPRPTPPQMLSLEVQKELDNVSRSSQGFLGAIGVVQRMGKASSPKADTEQDSRGGSLREALGTTYYVQPLDETP